MAQQVRKIGAVLWKHAHAAADAVHLLQIHPVPPARHGARGQHARGNLLHIDQGALGQQQHKFIAPQAANGVRPPGHLLQLLGDVQEHAIARLVAPAVIDLFEAIQIEVEQPHGATIALGRRYGLLHPVFEQEAIGQTRQGIVQGHVLHAVFFCAQSLLGTAATLQLAGKQQGQA